MTYVVTVGEAGSERGYHAVEEHRGDSAALRAARRRVCATYGRDGWWIVRDDYGREIGRGGRR